MAEIKQRSQFARDIMRSVEKRLSAFGPVEWPYNEFLKVENHQDFTGYIHGKMFYVKNCNGPIWVEYDGIKFSFEKKGAPPSVPPVVKDPQLNPQPVAKAKPKTKPKQQSKPVVENKPQEKPHMKPNYALLASDWINEHLEDLNNACNNAMSNSDVSDVLTALLPKDILPQDVEFWEAIAEAFVEEDEIDSYKIKPNEGVEIYIKMA